MRTTVCRAELAARWAPYGIPNALGKCSYGPRRECRQTGHLRDPTSFIGIPVQLNTGPEKEYALLQKCFDHNKSLFLRQKKDEKGCKLSSSSFFLPEKKDFDPAMENTSKRTSAVVVAERF